MSEVQEHEHTDDEVFPEVNGGGGNFAERLREKRKAIADAKEFYLEIQGYDGELVACYGKMEWEELAKIGRSTEKSKNPRKELLAQCDTLLKACIGVYFQPDGDSKKRVPLAQIAKDYVDEIEGHETITFDVNLARFLGFADEAGSARQIVLKTFNNELAIGPHHNEVAEWMQSSSSESDKDF